MREVRLAKTGTITNRNYKAMVVLICALLNLLENKTKIVTFMSMYVHMSFSNSHEKSGIASSKA